MHAPSTLRTELSSIARCTNSNNFIETSSYSLSDIFIQSELTNSNSTKRTRGIEREREKERGRERERERGTGMYLTCLLNRKQKLTDVIFFDFIVCERV